jgi:hypothetical protein
MDPTQGHGHVPIAEQTQKHRQTQTHLPKATGLEYTNTDILDEGDIVDNSAIDDGPRDDGSDNDEDATPSVESENDSDADCSDPFYVYPPSLSPVKWLWVPKSGGGSRIIWASMDLTLRFGAVESFRLFLTEILNVIYRFEKETFNDKVISPTYIPPSPLDLRGFFVNKWLVNLVRINASRKTPQNHGTHSEQISWSRYLSLFTIAIPTQGDYVFMRPDSLFVNIGRGAQYLRDPLIVRWMRLGDVNPNDLHDHARRLDINGWFTKRLEDYCEKLNELLMPYIPTEIIITKYKEKTLRDVVKRIREQLEELISDEKRGIS